MILKYKNTIYEPIFEVTDNREGLRDNDFWINIKFHLVNDEINFLGDIPGMSFEELKLWNEKNKLFLSNEMKNNQKVTFIRHLGEILYFPSEDYVEKRVYLFDDTDKYYPIIISRDELEKIYNINKDFINSFSNIM